jgi:hypothetical protein
MMDKAFTVEVQSLEEGQAEPQELRELDLHELDAVAGGDWVPGWFLRVQRKLRGIPEPLWA